ncbi:tyrosine-protein phosphatase [Pelagicoccus sp. SDUM812003]|uniref:tyrosine-protein phosphatase n=1 Tax=Pelagicoccus sp. SDUM812003 TaxID=3041267 RepID=UPI00280E8AE0|nr:tyrosine-protein phosphatase [Pelagicoccus sp. SDUM812003]MDQ8205451.1 tyrosine-protein phosphatase [Pelagicoccus sp. SDUM812003]
MEKWIHKAAFVAAAAMTMTLSLDASEEKRFPGMEGAINFRDLGGYETKDGRTIKWGKIYRSNALDKLTDDDLKLFQELGIDTVCDLREARELQESPDRLPEDADVEYLHLDIQAAMAEATGRKLDAEALMKLKDKSPAELEVIGDQFMEQGYAGFVLFGAPLYSRIFDELLEDDKNALVFHCQAGKDRAGVGSALVLLALGVDEETVIQDYMISGKVWSMPDEMIEQYADKYGIAPEVMKQFMGTKEKWLRSAFAAIKAKYGSFEAYFEEGLGLGGENLAKLRSYYLE